MGGGKGVAALLAGGAVLGGRRVVFELVLAGPEGTAGDRAELRRKIDEAGLHEHVQYVGAILGGDKTDRFAWANVYVQPSHHEGMPISMLEALAHALPVVATRVGAVPEVIAQGRQGLLVDPHEPARLADAMETLARDGEMRRTMATAAHALARERFSLERFESDLASVYEGVLTRPCRSGLDEPAGSEAKGLSNATALSSTR